MNQTKLPQFLALIAMLLAGQHLNAQAYKFYQSVGEGFESITPLNNGELMLVSGAYQDKVIYTKTTASGQPLYTRLLRNLNNMEAVDIEGIAEQGQQFMVVGRTGETPKTLFLVRMNLDGDTLWSRRLSAASGTYSRPSELVKLPNEELALAISSDNSGQQCKVFLNRIDTLGGQIWSKEVFTSGGDLFKSMNIFPGNSDNILARIDAVDTNASSFSASVLALFDGAGNNLFAKAFEVPGYGDIFWQSGVQTSDGGWAAIGYDQNDFATDHAIVLLKYSAQGTREFIKLFHFNQPVSNMMLDDFIQTSDGGYAATGFLSNSPESGIPLLRWDSNGDFLWGKGYGGPDPFDFCYGRGLLETANGNISIVGEDNRWRPSFGAVIIETSSTGATTVCTPSEINLLPLTVVPIESNYPMSMNAGPSWSLENSNLQVENLSTAFFADLVLGEGVGNITETTCENVCDGTATLKFDSIVFNTGVKDYIQWPGGGIGYSGDSLCSGPGTVVMGTDLGCKVNVDYSIGSNPMPGFSYTLNGLQVILNQNAPSTNCLQDGFLWIYGDGNADSLTVSPTYNFANAGTYTICIQCKTSACSTCATVNLPGTGSGNSVSALDPEHEGASIAIYPNPAKTEFSFQIDAKDRSGGRLRVSDVYGRVVHARTLSPSADLYQGKVRTDGWAKGIYIVEWSDVASRTTGILLLE